MWGEWETRIMDVQLADLQQLCDAVMQRFGLCV